MCSVAVSFADVGEIGPIGVIFVSTCMFWRMIILRLPQELPGLQAILCIPSLSLVWRKAQLGIEDMYRLIQKYVLPLECHAPTWNVLRTPEYCEAMLTVTTLPRPDHTCCQDRHDWLDIQHSICRSKSGLTSSFKAQDATFSSGLAVEEQRKQHNLQQNLLLRMTYLSHLAFLTTHTCAVCFDYMRSLCCHAQCMHGVIATKAALSASHWHVEHA